MRELQSRRVQHEPRHTGAGWVHAVLPIAEHTVADGGEVDADLVHASGERLDLHERRAGKRLDDTLAARRILAGRRRLAAQVALRDRQLDLAARG